MHILYSLAIFVSFASLALALPPTDSKTNVDSSLRLIKTSEKDPGVWVTEEEKLVKYVAKRVKFIDVTDITVS
jgi:leucyl aminopeptidase